MPAAIEEQVRGFALSDFTNIPNPPPDDGPKTEETPATKPAESAVAAQAEPKIKPLIEPDPEPEASKEKAKETPDPDGHDSLETAMRHGPEDRKKATEEKRGADKKTQEEAAAKAAEATGKPPPTDRDADLKGDPPPHVHPTTRKIITEFKTKAKAARDERDAVAKERDALKAERDQLNEKIKVAPASKELETEVTTLRERLREADITKDPIIEAKYDRPIADNNKVIVDTLKAQGFGKVRGEDDKMTDDPKAIDALVRGGLTLKNLTPLIKKLDEAELVEEAEAIREALRQNHRLTADKQREIESWKGDFSKRQQARDAQVKQQTEQTHADFAKHTDTHYRGELSELEKTVPYLRRPAEPLATDTPAVAKAKQTAIEEFDAAAKQIETHVREMSPANAPPEKQAEIGGRINANAILAVALKAHVIPKFVKDLAAREARIKELEAELGKIRDAGKLSRLQAGGSGDAGRGNGGGEQPASLEDALRMAQPRAHG